MTNITIIDSSLFEQMLHTLETIAAKVPLPDVHITCKALRAALAAQPSNYSDWQQRRGVLADIVDEALASYEAWMAEDDYNATDALHKSLKSERQCHD